MENIAIVFSGQLRTYDKCFKVFKSNMYDILQIKYNCDIFCHFWENEEEYDIYKAIELYKPKKHVIDTNVNYKLPKYCNDMKFHKCKNFPYGRIDGHINQKYAIYRGFQLVDKEIKDYKYIIRVRYDCLFESIFDMNEIRNIKEGTLNIGYGHTKYLNELQTNINDSFAFGHYKDMDKYFKFYEKTDIILKNIYTKNIPIKYNYLYDCIGFALLYKFYLDYYCNLDCNVSNIKFCLLRTNGNKVYFSNCHYTYESRRLINIG
jgi:hypothetical protein